MFEQLIKAKKGQCDWSELKDTGVGGGGRWNWRRRQKKSKIMLGLGSWRGVYSKRNKKPSEGLSTRT